VKAADAPPAGWYPDPRGGQRLRWWDGTDWADHWRPRPGSTELAIRARRDAAANGTTTGAAAAGGRAGLPASPAPVARGLDQAAAQDVIAEVRKVARSEIDRAAELFTQRARAATREIEPLVSQYTSRVLRWLRLAAVIALVLVIAWFTFQTIAQVSFFEWLGDRIDNLTN
jgi:hypothetical protein